MEKDTNDSDSEENVHKNSVKFDHLKKEIDKLESRTELAKNVMGNVLNEIFLECAKK